MRPKSFIPIALCAMLAGCGRDIGSGGAADSNPDLVSPEAARGPAEQPAGDPAVEVLDATRVDFGTVDSSREPLEHTFTLANTLDMPLTVANVRRSCGCLSVGVEPETLPPGGTAEVAVSMDINSIAGERKTSVLVEFDRDGVEAVYLELRAWVVSDYQVNVSPLVWSVHRSAGGPTRVERRFEVTELVSRGVDDDRITEGETGVSSESPYVSVRETGEFKPIGWRRTGYARESEILLALDLPPEASAGDGGDFVADLVFEHIPLQVDPGAAASPQSARVSLRIRAR